MATTPTPGPAIPEVVYAMFCGDIAQVTAQKVVAALANVMGAKSKHVHLLFQTAGGFVGDGVFLHNLFKSVPIELTLYNCGQVSSAGVIAHLGAKHRKTTKTATFMLHHCGHTSQFATATKLKHTVKSLILDDQRTEDIIRSHVNFPPEYWTNLEHHDIYVSGEEAVQFGIADEIAEFAPPVGTQVFNILG